MRTLADVRVENHLMFAEHNMPCPICLKKPAVFDCQREFFSPCWDCQKDGWRTMRKRRFSV